MRVMIVMKNPSFLVHCLINTIKICPCSTRCGNVCIVKRTLKGTMKIHCTRSTRHGQQWPANGANFEIFSNCFCMHWNLTWMDYSHALMIWEGFHTEIRLTVHPLVLVDELRDYLKTPFKNMWGTYAYVWMSFELMNTGATF